MQTREPDQARDRPPSLRRAVPHQQKTKREIRHKMLRPIRSLRDNFLPRPKRHPPKDPRRVRDQQHISQHDAHQQHDPQPDRGRHSERRESFPIHVHHPGVLRLDAALHSSTVEFRCRKSVRRNPAFTSTVLKNRSALLFLNGGRCRATALQVTESRARSPARSASSATPAIAAKSESPSETSRSSAACRSPDRVERNAARPPDARPRPTEL